MTVIKINNLNIFGLDSLKAEGIQEVLTALGISNREELKRDEYEEDEEGFDFDAEEFLEFLESNPSSLREKENRELEFTKKEVEERIIDGVKVIIYYPENSDDWNALKRQKERLKDHKVKNTEEGVVYIFPNLLKFCRERKIVDCSRFASIASGVAKKKYEDLPWVCVDQEYSGLQPYKELALIKKIK